MQLIELMANDRLKLSWSLCQSLGLVNYVNYVLSNILGMCGIDFLFRFRFGSVFLKKNWDSVWNELGSVPLKNAVRFRYCNYLLLV